MSENSIAQDKLSDEDLLARRCIDLLWDRDRASGSLGLEIVEITAGRAVLRMKVRDDMINGHDLVHGGLTFLLADTAIAFAANSRNESSVPTNCSIDFVRPGLKGQVLTVVAEETSVTRRSKVIDATVYNEDQKVVAHVRGRATNLGHPLIEDEGTTHD